LKTTALHAVAKLQAVAKLNRASHRIAADGDYFEIFEVSTVMVL